MSNQTLPGSSSGATADLSDRIWQQRALTAAQEAGLASRLLRQVLANSNESNPHTSPLPVLPPAALPVDEDVVYNVEAIERTAKHITVTGWAFFRPSRDCRRTRIACLICAGDNWFCVPVTAIHRPDVAAVFPAPDAMDVNRAYAGFEIRFECESFRSAPFQARLLMQEGNGATVSSGSFDLPIHV